MRRRSFGEISLLSSGRFRARYSGPDGERHTASITFDSKQDAQAWLAYQHRRISALTWMPSTAAMGPERQIFGEYAKISIGRRSLRPGTAALYERLLRLDVLPAFGHLSVAEITPDMVAAWYAGLASTPTQQANAYALLKSVMKDAVADRFIEHNPCEVQGGSQKRRTREMEVLSVEQLMRYFDAIPGSRRVPLLFAGWCGLRSGEVRGLRVRDLDLAEGVVHVRQAVVRLTGQL